jgi:hypothetical protein
MADPVLALGQYSIGTDMPGGDPNTVVYGYGTTCLVQNTLADTGSMTTQDTPVVGHDGVLFGVDTLPGMVVTQTGVAYANANGKAALDAFSQLAGKWLDPAARMVNGQMQKLRAYYPVSNVVRVAYGRGRKIQPTYGTANQGAVPFSAQFQAADCNWYADTESILTLTSVPSYLGTFTFPVTPPFQWASAYLNYQQNALVNSGPIATWPVITFNGPISFPGIAYVNTAIAISYQGVLPAGQSLVLDTRPWARTALIGTASVAGLLNGSPMISLGLPQGATVVRLTGTDYTGTATCQIKWRNAWPAIGGSLQ